MKKMLLIFSLLCFYIQADEFVSSSTSLGGYGELHWNMEGNDMDFHRFVIFYGHNWDDQWSLKAEVELEHNMVKGGTYGGELELEQAYVNYYNGKWGFKGGVLLATPGFINSVHEPPTFLSVERPDYHKYIIPSTWFGNGFGFYGNYGNWSFDLTMLEDLRGDVMTSVSLEDDDTTSPGCTEGNYEAACGDSYDWGSSSPGGKYAFRDARGKGDTSTSWDFTKMIRVDYNGIDGLSIGGSMTINDMPHTIGADANGDDKVDVSIGMDMNELHIKYNKNNIIAVFETATVDFDFSELNKAENRTGKMDLSDNTGALAKNSEGHYFDLGYNIGSLMPKDCNLVLWTRMSSWDSNTKDNSKKAVGEVDKTLFGLTWWPNDNIAFKVDQGEMTTSYMEGMTKKESKSDIMNIGIGYMF